MFDTITFHRDDDGDIRWRYTLVDETDPVAQSSAGYSQLVFARRDAYRVAGLDPADPAYMAEGPAAIRRRGTTSVVSVQYEDGLG